MHAQLLLHALSYKCWCDPFKHIQWLLLSVRWRGKLTLWLFYTITKTCMHATHKPLSLQLVYNHAGQQLSGLNNQFVIVHVCMDILCWYQNVYVLLYINAVWQKVTALAYNFPCTIVCSKGSYMKREHGIIIGNVLVEVALCYMELTCTDNIFWMKTGARRDGTLKNHASKLDGNDTTIYHPYILCHFAMQLCTHAILHERHPTCTHLLPFIKALKEEGCMGA